MGSAVGPPVGVHVRAGGDDSEACRSGYGGRGIGRHRGKGGRGERGCRGGHFYDFHVAVVVDGSGHEAAVADRAAEELVGANNAIYTAAAAAAAAATAATDAATTTVITTVTATPTVTVTVTDAAVTAATSVAVAAIAVFYAINVDGAVAVTPTLIPVAQGGAPAGDSRRPAAAAAVGDATTAAVTAAAATAVTAASAAAVTAVAPCPPNAHHVYPPRVVAGVHVNDQVITGG